MPTPATLHVASPDNQIGFSGRYDLIEGETENGQPVWKLTGGDRYIFLNSHGYWQLCNGHDEIKANKGSLASGPHYGGKMPHELAAGTWRFFSNGKWTTDAKTSVSDSGPPPPPSLHVASPDNQIGFSGRYDLIEGETENGQPVWKLTGGDRYIFLNSHGYWQLCNGHDEIKANKGSLASGPHYGGKMPHELAAGTWRFFSDGKWTTDAKISVVLPMSRARDDAGALDIDILPDTPWDQFADPRGLAESLRVNQEVRTRVPLLDTVIDNVEAKMTQLRLSAKTGALARALEPDELMGIVLYTYDNLTFDKRGNFYYEENIDLRLTSSAGRVQMLRMWGTHVCYTLRGLNKLPDVDAIVYRGFPAEHKDHIETVYQEGLSVQFNAFTSTATEIDSAEDFAGPSGVVLVLKIRTGKDIQLLSMIPGEKEVLLTPRHRFVVTKAMYRKGSCFYVDLLETRAGTYQF